MKSILYLLLACTFLLCAQPLSAQQKANKKRKGNTTNTSYGAKIKEPPAPKEYMHIYRPNTRGTLLGNKCMDDYTEKRGFRYVVMPGGIEERPSVLEMRAHNFGVKFILLLKNGPFWHHRLNKELRKCRESTGDYMG